MIDIDRLRFPTGTGVAVILKSPGAGPAKSIVLVLGIVLSAAIYFPTQASQLTRPVSIDEVPQLLAVERITPAEAALTETIEGWIEAGSAPILVLERGWALTKLRDAKVRLAEDPANRELRQEIRDRQAALDGDEFPIDPAFNDALAVAASKAMDGEAEWDSLRVRETGWATAPRIWGYADLGIRMSRAEDPAKAPRDIDRDGEPEPGLIDYVDHDQSGRPDLLVTDEKVYAGRWLGLPDQFELVFAIAPFALGAGFITGKAGLLVLAGGILAYFVLTPFAFGMGWMPETLAAHEAPQHGFLTFNRPLGIGLLLGGALMGIAASLPAIGAALKSIAASGKAKGGRDELGLTPLAIAALGAVVLLFFAARTVGSEPLNRLCPVTEAQVFQFDAGDPEAQIDRPHREFKGYVIALEDEDAAAVWDAEWDEPRRDAYLTSLNARPGWLSGLDGTSRAALIAIIGALWIWLAGIIIAQCTGMTDWSPISGMALLTVVLVMMLAGTGAVVGAVLIGAALCVAITLAADMMADLRTGHLLGAKPRRQQIIELCVVGIGPAISMLVVIIIAQANLKLGGPALGPGAPNGAEAPQAQALQAVITGVQGGEMPYALYGFGALMGALLGLGAFSGLGVLVGLSMYLPFYYIATYGIGCVVQMTLSKTVGKRPTEEWGVPFAAGLIVGESILALFVNLYILLST
jgi:hypothetical protein